MMFLSKANKWPKKLLVQVCALFFPFIKKLEKRMLIFDWFWFNYRNSVTSDVIYCQWEQINQINRWKLYFTSNLLKYNIIFHCIRNIIKNGELWGPYLNHIIYTSFIDFKDWGKYQQ